MLNLTETESVLDLIDSVRVIANKDFINVGDDRDDVGRAVGRHVLPDGLKVLPEVENGLDDTGRSVTREEKTWFAVTTCQRSVEPR